MYSAAHGMIEVSQLALNMHIETRAATRKGDKMGSEQARTWVDPAEINKQVDAMHQKYYDNADTHLPEGGGVTNATNLRQYRMARLDDSLLRAWWELLEDHSDYGPFYSLRQFTSLARANGAPDVPNKAFKRLYRDIVQGAIPLHSWLP